MKGILIFLVLLYGCSSSNKSHKQECIRLVKARYEVWYSGAEGNKGRDYYFEITNTCEPITVDSVWIGNKGFPSIVTEDHLTLNEESARRKKEITTYEIYVKTQKRGSNDPEFITPEDTGRERKESISPSLYTSPIPYNGEALIRYYNTSGEEDYMVVDTIIKKGKADMMR